MNWTLGEILEDDFLDISNCWCGLKSTFPLFVKYLIFKYMDTEVYTRSVALGVKKHEFTTHYVLYEKIGLYSISFEFCDKSNSLIEINKSENLYITNLILYGNTDLIMNFNTILKSYGCHEYFKVKVFEYGLDKLLYYDSFNFDNLLVEGVEFLNENDLNSPKNIFDVIEYLNKYFKYEVTPKNINKLMSRLFNYNIKLNNLNIVFSDTDYLGDFRNRLIKMLSNSNLNVSITNIENLCLVLDNHKLKTFVDYNLISDISSFCDLLNKYNIKIKLIESDEDYIYVNDGLAHSLDKIEGIIRDYFKDIII